MPVDLRETQCHKLSDQSNLQHLKNKHILTDFGDRAEARRSTALNKSTQQDLYNENDHLFQLWAKLHQADLNETCLRHATSRQMRVWSHHQRTCLRNVLDESV